MWRDEKKRSFVSLPFMYSGTTFRTKSGRVMGVHQRIDRIARRRLASHIPEGMDFPTYRDIVHFEGKNGPDGIKRKSPAQDEPWHFINPDDDEDTALLDIIDEHIRNLSRALQQRNYYRAAFEAAWMSHAITDGLTPAHHYPYEQKIEELRGGAGLDSRTTAKEKLFFPGDTAVQRIKNNWEYWGAGGMMTTHLQFELGVMTALSGAKLSKRHRVTAAELTRLTHEGFRAQFVHIMKQVNRLGMYDEFQKKGWTTHLAQETRSELIPLIILAVCLGWYSAIMAAEKEQM